MYPFLILKVNFFSVPGRLPEASEPIIPGLNFQTRSYLFPPDCTVRIIKPVRKVVEILIQPFSLLILKTLLLLNFLKK